MANLDESGVAYLWGKMKQYVSDNASGGGNNVLRFYPVGSIYQTMDTDFNPNETWGGTWERVNGRVLVGVDENQTEFSTVGKEGGSKYLQNHSHTLSGTAVSAGAHTHHITYRSNNGLGSSNGSPHSYNYGSASGTVGTNSAGAHTHAISGSAVDTGSGNAQNLQPYVTCYIWKRVA